ncbi:unnamed protein product [Rhizophagus irregularis]|nr:unnamed protein product [Rhizophagus irregularis]
MEFITGNSTFKPQDSFLIKQTNDNSISHTQYLIHMEQDNDNANENITLSTETGVLIVNFLALNKKRITVSVSEIKEVRKQSGFALTNHIIFFYRFITYEYAKAHYKQPRNQSKRRLQAIENKE